MSIKNILLLLTPLFFLSACDTLGKIQVTTSEVSDITSDSAVCGGRVSVTGNYTIGDCGVCYSTEPTLSLESPHTSDGYGEGTFSSTLTDLQPETTYYVKAYANTSSGYIYGDIVQFKTKKAVILSYGDGVCTGSWGLSDGGTYEWAVMFPTDILSQYSGMMVSKVNVYSESSRLVTLKIYQGGSTSPQTLLASQSVYLSSGWNEISSFTPFSLDTSKSLWLTLCCSHKEGVYPAAASSGIENKNARWTKSADGSWYDVYDKNKNRDLCWMIQARLSNRTKSVSLSYEQPDEGSILYDSESLIEDCDARNSCNTNSYTSNNVIIDYAK